MKASRGKKSKPDPRLTERRVRDNGLEVRTINPKSTAYEEEEAIAKRTMVQIGPHTFRSAARHELKRRKQKGPRGRNELIKILMAKARSGEPPKIYKHPQARKMARAGRKREAAAAG